MPWEPISGKTGRELEAGLKLIIDDGRDDEPLIVRGSNGKREKDKNIPNRDPWEGRCERSLHNARM